MSTPRYIDISGQRFDRLTAQSYAYTGPKYAYWNCLCDCGKTVITAGCRLRNGSTTSCGCSRYGLRMTHRSLWTAYHNARNRCTKPNHPDYGRYGARGIKFLFTSVQQMLDVMGPRPSKFHTLDRIDNNGNYEPGNVCWSTRQEQAQNRRKPRTSRNTYKGVHCNRQGKWRAVIKVNAQTFYLGVYRTEIEAAMAYDEAALKYFSRPCLNFPQELPMRPVQPAQTGGHQISA